VGARLLADIEQLVADLVDCRLPGDALPLAVDELDRIAQAALAQDIVANRGPLAAMRAAVDRAVIVRLLPDPHAIGDLGDHGASDRAVRADILAGGDGRAGRRWRTGLDPAHAVKREFTER